MNQLDWNTATAPHQCVDLTGEVRVNVIIAHRVTTEPKCVCMELSIPANDKEKQTLVVLDKLQRFKLVNVEGKWTAYIQLFHLSADTELADLVFKFRAKNPSKVLALPRQVSISNPGAETTALSVPTLLLACEVNYLQFPMLDPSGTVDRNDATVVFGSAKEVAIRFINFDKPKLYETHDLIELIEAEDDEWCKGI